MNFTLCFESNLRYRMHRTTEAILKKAATERKGRWSTVMQAKSTPLASVVMFWACTRMMFRSMVAFKSRSAISISFHHCVYPVLPDSVSAVKLKLQ